MCFPEIHVRFWWKKIYDINVHQFCLIYYIIFFSWCSKIKIIKSWKYWIMMYIPLFYDQAKPQPTMFQILKQPLLKWYDGSFVMLRRCLTKNLYFTNLQQIKNNLWTTTSSFINNNHFSRSINKLSNKLLTSTFIMWTWLYILCFLCIPSQKCIV